MKRTSILAIALALVLGAAAVIYACGNSSKTDQASTTGSSACGTAAKTSQVSATDKSQDVKALTADSKAKSCNEMSSSCGTTCVDKAKSASACPAMKDGSSAKQTKTTKIDDSAKEKAARAKTVDIKTSNAPLAANQE